MKQTQVSWVEERLKESGEIARNQCLANYISRLSAIIQILEEKGYTFITSRRNGDYVYTVDKRPLKKVYEYQLIFENGMPKRKEIIHYEPI